MSLPIHSIIFGFGNRARSGKDTAAAIILEERSCLYSIKIYSFAGELKREVTEVALKSGGIMNLFSEGLRMEGCGYLQENGNILALPDWVQPEPDPDMTDPLCPFGKFRSLLQWWGTEFRRNVNPNYWVEKVAERIAKDKPEIALITDVRFPNEVRFCQTYGEAILIHRPSVRLEGAAALHPSETALDNYQGWSDVVENNSTLEEFRDRVLFSFDSLMTTAPTARPASV
jgi:hypothetical protein